MTRRLLPLLLAGLSLLAAGVGWAQFRTAREATQHTDETPMWKNTPGFERDAFTFVRLQYATHGRRGHPYGNRRWMTDFPDADLNLSFRLQQMTSMKVDPSGRVLDITDPELFRYPFAYIVEPGDLELREEEVPILRRYLMNGGTLMVDDFWGEDEWENLAEEIKKVFPERDFVDLPRTHPLFHCVFDLPNDLNLQCPNVMLGTTSQYDGVTWERVDAHDVHVRAILDDKGRIMVIATHNTDNGDGWEREGENQYYFREFSEKKSYPLTINILFFLMTH